MPTPKGTTPRKSDGGIDPQWLLVGILAVVAVFVWTSSDDQLRDMWSRATGSGPQAVPTAPAVQPAHQLPDSGSRTSGLTQGVETTVAWETRNLAGPVCVIKVTVTDIPDDQQPDPAGVSWAGRCSRQLVSYRLGELYKQLEGADPTTPIGIARGQINSLKATLAYQ